eukprot:gene4746-21047_t
MTIFVIRSESSEVSPDYNIQYVEEETIPQGGVVRLFLGSDREGDMEPEVVISDEIDVAVVESTDFNFEDLGKR